MAVPAYSTDLSTWALAESTDTTGEFANMISGGSPVANDTDDIIQGSYHASATCKISSTQLGSIALDSGANQTIPTDGAVLMWHKFDAGGIIDTEANGGIRFVIGTTTTAWSAWNIGGGLTAPYPYGGYKNYALNPTANTADYTNSGGTGTSYRWAGSGMSLTATGPGKGNPHKVDAIRFGRGSIISEFGSVGDGYANFADMATKNDANDATAGYNRWGLFQSLGGSNYLWKGKLTFGSATNATEFVDTDINISIDYTPQVTANFNTIEIIHASTVVNLTNVTISHIDATNTNSIGRWIMTNDADVTLTGCKFVDMGAFTFDSNSNIGTTTFQRCGLVTQGGGDFDDCLFDEPSGSVGFHVDNLDIVDNCDFISDGTGYSMELDSSMAGNSYTLSGCTWTGYAGTDGSTGNECIYNNITGADVTISVGAGQQPTVHDASTSTTIITSSVPLYIIVKDTAGDPIQNAQVYIATASGGTQIINQDTDVNGEIDTSYALSTPQTCIVWVRKASSADSPKYKNYSSEQTIASITGLSLAITLQEDPFNNATT